MNIFLILIGLGNILGGGGIHYIGGGAGGCETPLKLEMI